MNNYKLVPAGAHMIAGFEGYLPHPYNDVANNATIGYGHLLHFGPVTPADNLKWKNVTYQQLYDLFLNDLKTYETTVNNGVTVKLGTIINHGDARFAALVSLCYNIGQGAFLGSTLLKLVNERNAPRDWSDVGTAFLAWDHAGGAIVQGLLNRRRVEAHVFLTGQFPTPQV